MEYGLSDNVISRIQAIMRSIPAIERAIIYGSRARGDNRNGSDIDLTLDGDNLNLKDLYHLYNELDDLLLPYHFDLSIHRDIQNPALRLSIANEGQIFYE